MQAEEEIAEGKNTKAHRKGASTFDYKRNLRCANLLKTKRNLLYTIEGISPYRAVNTFHHGYKNQSVNDV